MLFLLVAALRMWAQGPPYQTDDPVPVDLHHYEFYIFGGADGTPAETDSTGPGLRVQLGCDSARPAACDFALGSGGAVEQPAFIFRRERVQPSSGSRIWNWARRLRIIKETKHIPQIGSFTMFEMPTGNYSKGLGVGKVWYRLPLWLQKNIGKWLLDGGAGYQVVPQTGYRNFPYEGFLLKYTFGERLELGGEVFSHGAEGLAAPQTRPSTLIDFGGYYHFKHNPNEQFLFCYGHSVAGQTENYAYVGMYWTWGGKSDQKPDPGSAFLHPAVSPNGVE